MLDCFLTAEGWELGMGLIFHLLLLGLAVFAIAEFLPGIRLESFRTALVVGVVYSVVDVIVGSVLRFIGFPFLVISLGLFLLLINTFLLWLTDKLIEDFEINNIQTTFFAAVLITGANVLLGWVL